jgi:hypothetical protein
MRQALCLLLTLAGCTGTFEGPAAAGDCEAPSVEAVLATYTEHVHPLFLQSTGGCVACHAEGSGRQFIVSQSAAATFSRARIAHLFAAGPGTLVARLSSEDSTTRMPQGGAAWSPSELSWVKQVACQLQALEADGGPLADEQFPPELDEPYTGPANTDYDDTFINQVQLKAKVQALFQDDWVRDGGEDEWAVHMGLLGGVDFQSHLVEARAATPEFLLAMDALAPDVCGRAVQRHTGPFTGLDVSTAVVDTPAATSTTLQALSLTEAPATAGQVASNPAAFFCFADCTFTGTVTLPAPGQYTVTVRAKAQNLQGVGPQLQVMLGTTSVPVLTFTDESQCTDQSATVTVTQSGVQALSVEFINDSFVAGVGDRNVWVQQLTITGPLGNGTGTLRQQAAQSTISTLYQRLLFRPASADEQAKAYALLTDLAALNGDLAGAWSGVCEGLLKHPDFLFTLPPAFDAAPAAQRPSLLLVGLAQNLVGRPPTPAEFDQLATTGYASVVDAYLGSDDFRRYFFNRMRLRTESQGTTEADEPARLWTYLATTSTPFSELFTGDYSVDAQFAKQARPPEHGHTGVLTMRGYVSNKPGLPHFNYPARVLEGFMGYVFEIPPSVFDQRGTATAASTVDPTSICYNCHQLLTPMAHQRLKWADTGDYRTVDDQGQPIDDTDRGFVPDYEFKGAGMEAFATHAVKKERFIRRLLNTQFRLLMGRELRHDADERGLYRQLWDLSVAQQGDLRAITRAVALSPTFMRSTP